MQFVSSTKIEKKMHFENLIDHFLAFSTKSVPNYCMRFPATQKLHNPGIFVWAFVLSCLWLRGKLFSTSFSTNCVMSTLSDSFDSCNYTKRNHNLSDYKKGGFNKNSGLNSLGYLSAQNGRFGMILSKKYEAYLLQKSHRVDNSRPLNYYKYFLMFCLLSPHYINSLLYTDKNFVDKSY